MFYISTLLNLIVVRLIKQGVGNLLQSYRSRDLNKWRSMKFSLNHIVRGLSIAGGGGIEKLFLVNGLRV